MRAFESEILSIMREVEVSDQWSYETGIFFSSFRSDARDVAKEIIQRRGDRMSKYFR